MGPRYYSGVLGFGFLIGGSTLLCSRLRWPRWVILLFSGALTASYTLCLVRVSVPAWGRDSYPMHSVELVALGVAAGIASLMLVALCLPGAKAALSDEPRSPSSPTTRAQVR